MDRVLITVIIPIYNVDKYLDCCIQSVLQQTYSYLDIILVDDGSTDKSPEICDFYSKKDERVTVLHQKNCGAAAARNHGLSKAKGEYILFVDGDDYIHPEMILRLYTTLSEKNADMAMCGFVCVGENEQSYQPCNSASVKQMSVNGVISESDYWTLYYNTPNIVYIVVWNKLVKKCVYEGGIRFTEGKRIDDEFIIHKIVAGCTRIACIEDNLYCYRKRQGSAMTSVMNVGHLDVVEARVLRARFFRERELQYFSEKSITFALGDFVDVKSKIDLRSKNAKKRCKQLRKMCLKEGGKVFAQNASIGYRIAFSLFLLGDGTYKRIAAVKRRHRNIS